jgi:hypothetical protein
LEKRPSCLIFVERWIKLESLVQTKVLNVKSIKIHVNTWTYVNCMHFWIVWCCWSNECLMFLWIFSLCTILLSRNFCYELPILKYMPGLSYSVDLKIIFNSLMGTLSWITESILTQMIFGTTVTLLLTNLFFHGVCMQPSTLPVQILRVGQLISHPQCTWEVPSIASFLFFSCKVNASINRFMFKCFP